MKTVNQLKLVLSLILLFGSIILSQAQSSGKSKILFATKPFVSNPTPKTSFKSGEAIYGRVTLDKPLKNYSQKIHAYELEKFNIANVYSDYLEFRADPIDQDPNQRSWSSITLYLKPSDLEKNFIDFDIMPTEANASSFFGTAFFNELANSSSIYNYFEKKIDIVIKLMKKGINLESDQVIVSSNLTMDYSEANYENLAEWKNQCNAIQDTINSKFSKK